MRRKRILAKGSLKDRTFCKKSCSKKYKLISSINKLNYDELLFVSQAGNDYYKGIKPHTIGVKKLDSLAKSIHVVSSHDRRKAKKILESIDKEIVKKNKVSVKITAEARQKFLELMRK